MEYFIDNSRITYFKLILQQVYVVFYASISLLGFNICKTTLRYFLLWSLLVDRDEKLGYILKYIKRQTIVHWHFVCTLTLHIHLIYLNKPHQHQRKYNNFTNAYIWCNHNFSFCNCMELDDTCQENWSWLLLVVTFFH